MGCIAPAIVPSIEGTEPTRSTFYESTSQTLYQPIEGTSSQTQGTAPTCAASFKHGSLERMSDADNEIAELRKDKERLDWLMENVICAYERSWHPEDTEYLANRDEIDEAMGGAG